MSQKIRSFVLLLTALFIACLIKIRNNTATIALRLPRKQNIPFVECSVSSVTYSGPLLFPFP